MASGEDWDLAQKIATIKQEVEIQNVEFQGVMIILLLLQQLSTGKISLGEFIDELVDGMHLSVRDNGTMCNTSLAYDFIRENPILKQIFKDILFYFIDLFEKQYNTTFDGKFAHTKQWIIEN